MTNRWVQPVASVVAMVMIANLQYAWTSSFGSGHSSAFSAQNVDRLENVHK